MKLPPSLKKSSTTALLALSSIFAAVSFSACYNVSDMVNGAVHDASVKGEDAIKSPQSFASLPKSTADQNQSYEHQVASIDELKNYNWQLVSAEVQGAPIHSYEWVIKHQEGKLEFFNQNIYFNVGCNQNLQNYQFTDGILTLSDSRTSTMMACPIADGSSPSLHQVESKLANDLDGAKFFIETNAQEHTAILKQVKGAEVLTWQGQMKYDVRFGEPVRLFWEIDPETINCIDEAGRDQQCLKVRHVSYDEQGIKLGSGAWRTFYGKIHGYEHQPNRRQIIRLHAYNNPDGDENPYYVYDMAIETHVTDQ
ncbi:META domain-containing protein [Moraxella sp. RCAD0137]|uniref:META domain-containing protein n=1 Tax=Moraxella sp. RCAD0137 TaxID=1775913 RepID=UPI000C9F006E|nr:DUF4377 domain-containing protein [Moraxella sp. RCAD0137]PNP98051.1 hypothetical protein AZ602_04710 [Moraxella sp. RCAD0137]